jgi:hypothetical protein
VRPAVAGLLAEQQQSETLAKQTKRIYIYMLLENASLALENLIVEGALLANHEEGHVTVQASDSLLYGDGHHIDARFVEPTAPTQQGCNACWSTAQTQRDLKNSNSCKAVVQSIPDE